MAEPRRFLKRMVADFMIGIILLLMKGPAEAVQLYRQHGGLDKRDIQKIERSDLKKKVGGLSALKGNSYPNLYYRGLCAIDFRSGNFGDELVGDFGALGVWAWECNVPNPLAGSWNQLSGTNPDWIISVKWGNPLHWSIIGDFGAIGLWHWTYNGYPGTWTQISGINADNGLAADDDNDGREEFYVYLPGAGLYRYDLDGNSWTSISAQNPAWGWKMNIGVTGWEQAGFSFPGLGVWRIWFNGSPQYEQLTAANSGDDYASAEFGIGDSSEELALDFGASGISVADESSYPCGWYSISSQMPNGLKEVRFGGDDYELLADFVYLDGLWCWDYSGYPGNWVQLTASVVGGGFYEPFDPNGNSEGSGDQEVAVDFMSLGLWLFDSTNSSWTQLSGANPVFMVAADVYGSGKKEFVAVDFGAVGLWAYDGRIQGWTMLAASSPDN